MKRVLSIFMVCILVLSGCGSEETPRTKQEVTIQENKVRYKVEELSLPESLLAENAQGSDYIGDEFSGFTADLNGKPAVYYSDFTKEDEVYQASITRHSMDQKKNWESEELCENSLSEFMDQKFEQTGWVSCHLSQFRRGDNGSLYGIFFYYVKEDVESDEGKKEMLAEKYSVLEIDEENDRIYEIPLEIGPAPRDENDFGKDVKIEWLSDYHAFEDGSILLLSSDNGGGTGYLIDGESGQVSEELGSVVTGKRRFVFGENEIIFFSNKTNLFQVVSLPDVEEMNTFGSGLSEDVMNKDWFFYMNPDNWELFMCNRSGVYKAANYQNSDDVEWLTEKTDMSEVENGNADILDFFVGAEDDFYICMVETTEEYGEKTRQYRIVYYSKEGEPAEEK